MTSKNVTLIEHDGRTFYLVGTAHVSKDSVDEVRDLIEELQPDTVCIELCDTRYRSLTDEAQWDKLDIFEVIREGKTLFLLANLALGAYQRRLGQKLGVKPGAEMLEAAEAAQRVGAELALVDRDIQITLKRTWANVGFFKKLALLASIFDSLLSGKGDVDAEEIEKLKQQEQLSSMLEEFAEAMPEVKAPLIDERDLYMVSKARETSGERVVIVVGAGHVPGMSANFKSEIDREPLEVIPPPSKLGQGLKWVIPTAVIAAFYFGYRAQGGEGLETMLYSWVLPNMIFAALFTLIAGARLPSVLTAAFASPLTSLNPLLPVGVPVGYVEAKLRKPTVKDAERIPDDVQSLRGFYRNPFTRTLLVVMMSILGSAAGAWIGITWMLTLFKDLSG
jgi:pheromone shutdown-related protein TraB